MLSKTKIVIISAIIPLFAVIYGLFTKQYSFAANSLYSVGSIILFVLIHNKFSFLSKKVYISVIIFILLSAFAGKALEFYKHIPHWDKLLHFASGFIFVPAGRQLYKKISSADTSIKVIHFFALFFAIAAAALWEIFEFSGDSLFGTTAQNNSLDDTMLDMLAGTLSAVIATIIAVLKLR